MNKTGEPAPPRRMLNKERINPSSVIGKVLLEPDLKIYLSRVHQKMGWSKEDKDHQVVSDFSFDGKTFSNFVKLFLRLDGIEKVYFPLAYNGIVAKAIEAQGFKVLATDLSKHWVAHLKSVGLRAKKRSFEDIPNESFDIAVSFEPFPIIQDPVGYLGMLKLLSRDALFVQIHQIKRVYDHEKNEFHELDGESMQAPKERPFNFNSFPPPDPRRIERIAYDYGAGFFGTWMYGDSGFFSFVTLVPTQEAASNARLDLQMLSFDKRWRAKGEVSIAGLAESLSLPIEQVAASLNRIYEVLTVRFRGYIQPFTRIKIVE
ncbi:MAG: hypothetical protein M1530_03930 [Candidatus Marsarchaeota archaeon]|nr:hypothetical protein [Candidatus Marsarchaeota archaeon]